MMAQSRGVAADLLHGHLATMKLWLQQMNMGESVVEFIFELLSFV